MSKCHSICDIQLFMLSQRENIDTALETRPDNKIGKV